MIVERRDCSYEGKLRRALHFLGTRWVLHIKSTGKYCYTDWRK
jgi:hypothetical protein